MVSFKVKLPAEYMGEQVQEFSFGDGCTVAEAVKSVSDETKLSSPDLYTFYIPKADAAEGTWLDPSTKLSEHPVTSVVRPPSPSPLSLRCLASAASLQRVHS